MEEVTKQAGRTIIFVSHSMAAIQTLCKKTLYLKNGKIASFGNTEDVIREYLGGQGGSSATLTYSRDRKNDAFIKEIRFINHKGEASCRLPINENFTIEIDFEVFKAIKQSVIYIWFYSQGEILLSSSNADIDGKLKDFQPGSYTTTIQIPAFLFNHGNYFMDVRVQQPFVEDFDYRLNIPFEVIDAENPRTEIFRGKNLGRIASQLPFHIRKND